MRKSVALSAVVFANVMLSTGVGVSPIDVARAADECLAGPNAPSPQGSHWYYRIDRASKRRCWYLGPLGAKVARPEAPRAAPQEPPRATPSMPKPVSATRAEPQSTAGPLVPPPRAETTADAIVNRDAAEESSAAQSAEPQPPVADVQAPEAPPVAEMRAPEAPASTAAAAPSSAVAPSSVDAPPSSAAAPKDLPLVWPALPATGRAAAALPPPTESSIAPTTLLALLAAVFVLAGFAARAFFRQPVARSAQRYGFDQPQHAWRAMLRNERTPPPPRRVAEAPPLADIGRAPPPYPASRAIAAVRRLSQTSGATLREPSMYASWETTSPY